MARRARVGPVVVIGSINMDLVCRTQRLPRAGETILGSELRTIPGGKGANQAVAAARIADGRVDVHMIGRVGDDAFGRELLAGLKNNGVVTNRVAVTKNMASGVAVIVVDRKGENSIVVTPGANARLTPADIDAAEALIRAASVVVLQLEIPLATVRHALKLCRRLGVFTILDPAPAPQKRMRFDVDLLTPNETEARAVSSADAKAVVLKRGARGCELVTAAGSRRVKPFKVRVIDSTAAGDAFTGALAVAHALGTPMLEALRLANAAGALCCTKLGAQPALPTRRAVERLLRDG
ncbi:MAG: ribokinase [Phycisphaerales bacterium]|jgi:ribokinase|nr:ribokinase [Phycisphaerales bacterium]